MSDQNNSGRVKKVTQKDVADLAGVSSSIVSYVINDGPRSVSEETRQRVLMRLKSSTTAPIICTDVDP